MLYSEKIIKIREYKKISQEELAEYFKVTQNTIYRWENNKAKPSLRYMKLIDDLFNELNISEEATTNLEEPFSLSHAFKKFNIILNSILIGLICIFIIGIRIFILIIESKEHTGTTHLFNFYGLIPVVAYYILFVLLANLIFYIICRIKHKCR